ncbi:MAG: PIN domain-containing protein [Deltaproteobacteria bacterium]|nr:PIN domain-containing protein [Deltaproteobacteria bacterium]
MIAIDSSSLIAYLEGGQGPDVEYLDTILRHRQGVLPPVALSELLSDPTLPKQAERMLCDIPLLEILDGYWVRAGRLRALILGKGRKARLADTLIAQSCLDHGLALITRDADFQPFAKLAGLQLALG